MTHRSTDAPRGAPRRVAAALCSLAALLALPHAAAQGTIDREAQTSFQKEAAACRSSRRQDHANCMREAAAARDEARRGRLADRGASYEKNALQRCDRLPDDDRRDCMMRMQGQGTTTSGSVDGGGIYRETVRRVPGPMPPPKVTDTTPGAPQN